MTVQVQDLYDLFVSYTDADQEWVQGYLLDALTQAGVRYISESTFAIGIPRLLAVRARHPAEPAHSTSPFPRLPIRCLYPVHRFPRSELWPVDRPIAGPLSLSNCILSHLPPRLAMLEAPRCHQINANASKVIKHLCTELQRPRTQPYACSLACPYPGMVPFSAHNASFFHGRKLSARSCSSGCVCIPFSSSSARLAPANPRSSTPACSAAITAEQLLLSGLLVSAGDAPPASRRCNP